MSMRVMYFYCGCVLRLSKDGDQVSISYSLIMRCLALHLSQFTRNTYGLNFATQIVIFAKGGHHNQHHPKSFSIRGGLNVHIHFSRFLCLERTRTQYDHPQIFSIDLDTKIMMHVSGEGYNCQFYCIRAYWWPYQFFFGVYRG